MSKKKNKKNTVIVKNPVQQELSILQTLAESNKIIAQKLDTHLSLLTLENVIDANIRHCTFISEK